MKNKPIWIPKPLEVVMYKRAFNNTIAQVIYCNFGGKCKIRVGRNTVIYHVDINDLEKIDN